MTTARPNRFGWLALRAALLACLAGGAKQQAPDVVLVLVDDLGFGDAEWTATDGGGLPSPNLSRLARAGKVLTQFYVQPACTPTRTALLTGLYPINTGTQDFVIKQTAPIGLPLSFTLLPQRLKEVGFRTALVGKYHLGFYETAYQPQNRGFDVFYGMYTGDADHYTQVASSRVWLRSGGDSGGEVMVVSGTDLRDGSEAVEPDARMHSTERYTAVAVDVIHDTPADQPLFLMVAYQAVHFPLQVDEDLLNDASCTGLPQLEATIDPSNRQLVCGMLLGVDRGVAALETAIKERRSWDNTLLVFFSDNGGDNKWGTSNAPLRGHKDQVWEGGVRTPAFLSGGASEAAASGEHESAALTHVTDLHAMVLGQTGTSAERTDGVDQWEAIFNGHESARTELVLNINSPTFFNGGAIRIGDFKLIIEWNATVHDAVGRVMTELWQSETLPEDDTVRRLVQEQLGASPRKFLFNVAANPSEEEDGGCGDLEACSNLIDEPAFASVAATLQVRFDDLVQSSADPIFDWQDDGPLAMPSLFGGHWSAWRDSNGVPFAVYGSATTDGASQSVSRVTSAAVPSYDDSSSSLSIPTTTSSEQSSRHQSGAGGRSRPHTVPGYSWSSQRHHQSHQDNGGWDEEYAYWEDDMIGAAMFLLVCAAIGLAILYWYLARQRREAQEWEELIGGSTVESDDSLAKPPRPSSSQMLPIKAKTVEDSFAQL